MFIPRGHALHENLATSYVLIDALVEDLCEGGFSGVVEVLLRAGDCHVIIDQGRVAAAVEKRDNGALSHTTVPLLAARARVERGRISVRRYSAATAIALAGRLTAEPLYTGLSTDFADLEKMLAKLSRERDRQWFIEVNTASDTAALIHLDDDKCSVMIEDGEQEDETTASDFASSSVLRHLLDECSRAGARFDVYFKRAAIEEPVDLIATAAEPAEPEIAIEESIIAAAESHDASDLPDLTDSQASIAQSDEPEPISPPEAEVAEGEVPEPVFADPAAPDQRDDVLIRGIGPNTVRLFATASANDQAHEPAAAAETSEDEAMVEIKRLMGEIIRVIEDATREAEPQSKFSMYLRTGQLKIANRFPFLDPFGAEFEYLAGEIAFIGKATPAEFIEGLTEAIKHAITGVAQSSAQPDRLRKKVTEALRRLQSRMGPEIERFQLEECLASLTSPELSGE
ncbi:MAG TPA: hypothetical protein VNO14_19170 [Blastocatellia bacterium]|nr:hypothetical protein [Blastocatellia bacterium]